MSAPIFQPSSFNDSLIVLVFFILCAQVYSNETILSASDLLPIALKRLASPAHGNVAIDYFITHSNRFPWQQIPPFVIGRSAYDNWLVSHRTFCFL